jgi:ribonuclease G
MSAELLINVTPRETRVAVIENGVLHELFVERARRRGLVGNVYKGRVSRVLPGMQAAFVDIGLERAAFLHASDIVASSDAAGNGQGLLGRAPEDVPSPPRPSAASSKPHPDISALAREGQELLVQVIKDPLGTKGARLTTYVSMPSCYLVFMPGAGNVGVSQRIEDETERERLRCLVRELAIGAERGGAQRDGSGQGGAQRDETGQGEAGDEQPAEPRHLREGYIVRTAAETVGAELLQADMDFLHRLWRSIQERAQHVRAPGIVHEDLPLVIRTLRELSGTEIERVRIDSRETLQRVIEFTRRFIPEMAPRIELYSGERPVFDLYGAEDEIQRALERKVQLKSGGHLVIDQTEAMTTIDVNTGAYVGHRNLEETIFKTNLEATQAIARQLRLRNLGGIIIADFIDMVNEEHKRQVLRSLEKGLERDHTKTHVSDVSPLGLVQMTRKRTRESLEHVLCEPCPTCSGRGSIKTPETVCYEIFREILREARQYESERLLVLAAQDVVDSLMDEESTSLAELEEFVGKPITLQVEAFYSREQYDVVLI